jgi:histidine ammonia-lyase
MSGPQVVLGRPISPEDLEAVARHGAEVTLDAEARVAVDRSRAAVDAIAAAGDKAPNVYGVNTGFGALSETRISASDIRALQRNLVRSHSTGVRTARPSEVRGIMLLRAQVLALGHSGVRAVCRARSSRCSTAACTRASRRKARSAPRGISRRSRTSRWR